MFVNLSAIISCELWKNSFSKCQLLSESLVVFRFYRNYRIILIDIVVVVIVIAMNVDDILRLSGVST